MSRKAERKWEVNQCWGKARRTGVGIEWEERGEVGREQGEGNRKFEVEGREAAVTDALQLILVSDALTQVSSFALPRSMHYRNMQPRRGL